MSRRLSSRRFPARSLRRPRAGLPERPLTRQRRRRPARPREQRRHVLHIDPRTRDALGHEVPPRVVVRVPRIRPQPPHRHYKTRQVLRVQPVRAPPARNKVRRPAVPPRTGPDRSSSRSPRPPRQTHRRRNRTRAPPPAAPRSRANHGHHRPACLFVRERRPR
jgi:hypothetical protein